MKVNRQLPFMSICDIGDSLITIDEFGRGVFQINKSDMSSRLLTMIDNMETNRNWYQGAEQFGNEIFFFPEYFKRTDIIVYHMDKQQVEYLALQEINNCVHGEYNSMIRVDDSVMLFSPDSSGDAIVFHMDTRKVEIITSWKETMQNIMLDSNSPYHGIGEPVDAGENLYQTLMGTNHIIEINKMSYQVKCHTLPINAQLFATLSYDGQRLWSTELNNKAIISWEPATGNLQYYTMPQTFAESDISNWTCKVLCGKQYLWLIPYRDNKIARMSYLTGEYEYIDIFPQEFDWRRYEGGRALDVVVIKDHIADIYPFTANMAIHIDLENDSLLEQHEYFSLPAEWSDQDVIDYQLQNENGYEQKRIPPEIYMDRFFQSISKEEEREKVGNIGEKIWRQMSGV